MALDFNDVTRAVKDAIKGKPILHSNEAIGLGEKVVRGAINNGLGAGEMGYRVFKNGEGIKDAAIRTFAKNGEDVLSKGAKMELNYGKIAGSYIGLSAGARIISGGGAYKDRNGNSNLMGVPFI